jgi:ribonuclease HI
MFRPQPPTDALRKFTDTSIRKHQLGIGVFEEQKRKGIAGRVILPSHVQPTSDLGELIAVLYAIETTDTHAPLVIVTDSKNALNHIFKKCTPKMPIQREAVKYLREFTRRHRKDYTWFVNVKGHSGVYGNEQADMLARKGALLQPTRINDVITFGDYYMSISHDSF